MRFVGQPQTSFVAGEFAPDLYGRSDLQKYAHGAKSLENMYVKRQGGVCRRSGTIRVANSRTTGNARLVPFRRSSAVNFVLEFSPQFLRFFKNHAPVMLGPVPYEISTQFQSAQIDDLRFAQSADVLYITHPAFPPFKLSHLADTHWTLDTVLYKGGPFLAQNTNRFIVLTASAPTGAITLQANQSLFVPGDVSGIWKLQAEDVSNISKWMGNVGFVVGDQCISRGKFYVAVTENTSGTEAPDHTEGIQSDGRTTGSGTVGVKWQYLHSGYANVRIESYVNATQVFATVEAGMTLPNDIVSTGTYKWSPAAWSGARGWPTTVAFFQERLVFGKGNEFYGSGVADFENMSPTDKHGDVTSASAFRFVISDPKVDTIRWIVPSQKLALLGTSDSEYTIGAQNASNPFGPDNVSAGFQSANGSVSFLQPERIDDAVVYVNGVGRQVHEMTPATSGAFETYQSREISILAPHLIAHGAFEAAYCQDPDSIYWLVTNQGKLIGCTYEKEQEVIAWHHHEIGGTDAFVESICSIPEPNGRYHELWLLVARTINGVTVKSIEYMSQPWQDVTNPADMVFVDASFVVTGVVQTISGLDYLEGQSVQALVDGSYAGTFTVSGGSITLSAPSQSKVVVGLACPARLETLTPDPGSEVGASAGKRQRIVRAYIRFQRTAHCKVGSNLGPLDTVTFATGSQLMNAPLALVSGIKEVPFPAGYEDDPTVIIEQNTPLSLEVLGIVWDMNVAAR